jgi:bisphosphoglycerate-dependent phosphoglycerate mutase
MRCTGMERTIPFYLGTIYPESIAQGKSVLIASSENAIRGLLMHLCEVRKGSGRGYNEGWKGGGM